MYASPWVIVFFFSLFFTVHVRTFRAIESFVVRLCRGRGASFFHHLAFSSFFCVARWHVRIFGRQNVSSCSCVVCRRPCVRCERSCVCTLYKRKHPHPHRRTQQILMLEWCVCVCSYISARYICSVAVPEAGRRCERLLLLACLLLLVLLVCVYKICDAYIYILWRFVYVALEREHAHTRAPQKLCVCATEAGAMGAVSVGFAVVARVA